MRRFAGGLVAGLSATLLMEYASQAIYSRQGESREREEQLRTEMPTTALVRKTAGLIGVDLSEGAAQRAGMGAHYAFGAAGGPAAHWIASRGGDPIKAALTVAAAMELLVDQAANTALGLTAPTWRFPPITQARGVVAHGIYGAALGLLLSAGGDR